jgi:hypothetical protein
LAADLRSARIIEEYDGALKRRKLLANGGDI